MSHRPEAAWRLGERALSRRAKVLPPWRLSDDADLPVPEAYIARVESSGGVFAHSSRWLNAASFFLTAAQLEAVRCLPYVKKVEPVAVFRLRADERDGPAVRRPGPPRRTAGFDYGPSLLQIQAISVLPLHAIGITGRGVLIGMLDSGFRWRAHEALSSRHVIAEHDFIFNRDTTANFPNDDPAQDWHGTYTMSVLGGYMPGSLIGAAFSADFILGKTELIYPSLGGDTDSIREEDNWAAGSNGWRRTGWTS
jgi:serine protease AprX